MTAPKVHNESPRAKARRTTRITFILDKSGSMVDVLDATIEGFNKYLEELQKDGNQYTMTLVQFSTGNPIHSYITKSLGDIKPLDKDSYQPGGGTALYDAAVTTLKTLRANSSKNLVIILTDGEENSSNEYTEKDFKEIVEELDAKENFTFVYLGANQNAWDNAQKWGYKVGNVSTFNSTTRGVGETMTVMAAASFSLGSQERSATSNYFTPQQQEDLKNTK